MELAKYKRREVKRGQEVITCEKVQGGFIFEVSSGHFAPGDKRVVVSAVDAITLFCALIHGEKLNDISAHEEEKRND